MSVASLAFRAFGLALLLSSLLWLFGPIWWDTPLSIIVGAWPGIPLFGEGHEGINIVGVLIGDVVVFSVFFFLVPFHQQRYFRRG